MKDLHNNLKQVQVIKPQSGSSDVTGNDVDLQGYEAVEFVIQHAGGNSSETIEFKVQEKDSGGSYSDASTDDILGSNYSEENPSAESHRIGYIGDKQYATIKHVSDSSSVTFGAVAVKGKARHKPE